MEKFVVLKQEKRKRERKQKKEIKYMEEIHLEFVLLIIVSAFKRWSLPLSTYYVQNTVLNVDIQRHLGHSASLTQLSACLGSDRGVFESQLCHLLDFGCISSSP